MGVPGLWRELAAGARAASLDDLAWAHWERTTPRSRLRVGIDATSWLYHARQSRGGAQPTLRLLFFRAARLLRLPLDVVFVLDGAARPAVKRGADVYLGAHALEPPWLAWLHDAGLVAWRAPGEAEAELAWMCAEHLIDLVLTDDVDALVFGAGRVLRQGARDATLYEPDLGAEDLVLVALLAGGDYDTTGLARCGVKTVLGLARAGWGRRLVELFRAHVPRGTPRAAVDGEDPAWDALLAPWRDGVRRELRENTHGHLTRRHTKLAASLSDTFLGDRHTRGVLYDYVYPATSQHDAAQRALLEARVASPPVCAVGRLARRAQAQFGWGTTLLIDKFARLVVPGACVQQCVNAALADRAQRGARTDASADADVDGLADGLASLAVATRGVRILQGHATRVVGSRVEVCVTLTCDALVDEMLAAVHAPEAAAPRSMRLWIPASVLRQHQDAHVLQPLLASKPPLTLPVMWARHGAAAPPAGHPGGADYGGGHHAAVATPSRTVSANALAQADLDASLSASFHLGGASTRQNDPAVHGALVHEAVSPASSPARPALEPKDHGTPLLCPSEAVADESAASSPDSSEFSLDVELAALALSLPASALGPAPPEPQRSSPPAAPRRSSSSASPPSPDLSLQPLSPGAVDVMASLTVPARAASTPPPHGPQAPASPTSTPRRQSGAATTARTPPIPTLHLPRRSRGRIAVLPPLPPLSLVDSSDDSVSVIHVRRAPAAPRDARDEL